MAAPRRVRASDVVATVGLSSLTVGLWLERPALALIVVGAILFAASAWTHLRGGYD